MTTYNTADLIALGKSAENTLKTTFGYDNVAFISARVDADGNISFGITIQDDFQEHLAYGDRVDSEYARTFTLEQIINLSPQTHRNREQRELAVLARSVASVRHDRDKLVSAQAQAFVTSLDPLAAEISALIEKQPF
jgi:hypothetical protein